MNFDVSVCTWAGYDKNGFIGVQVDAFATQGRGMSAFHLLSPLGLLAMPVAPVGEAGALAVREFDASEGFSFLCNDVRTEHQLPELNPGATTLHDTGVYKGDAYLFTVTLDPKEKTATIESHRAAGKIVLKNKEGVRVEISGASVTVSGATSVKCGGEFELSLFAQTRAALDAIGQAITALQNPYAPQAPPLVTAAQNAIIAFGNGGKTQITKGA